MGTAKSQLFRLPIVDAPSLDHPATLPDVVDLGGGAASTQSLDELEAELARLDGQAAEIADQRIDTKHWFDPMIDPRFSKSERPNTTLLVSGLTAAHDYLVKAALTGLGYKVEVIDVPDNDALRYGKEFGNRGQCNPTYFTVGNLVKFLTERSRKEGLDPREMVARYVFLTAGACGPCRFGMYATEYRKALRDAGFDGFRVLLFQQKGGLKQATGEEAGLEMNPAFFLGLLKAIIAGDVINGMGYRLRPFEVTKGATDRAIENTKRYVHDALVARTSILRALLRGRREFATIALDWTRPCARVSIIGEFWAMTTEGDGNYQLQRFLESEGAECDIQFVTNWLLFMLWEGRYDTKLRAELRGLDQSARKGLKDARVGKKLAGLFVGDLAIRAAFHLFGAAVGYRGYHLPDMDEIAESAHAYYNNNVRGGEGHMEVGKFILNVLHNKVHMTLSVKPFGCMPSSGVSDGVQSLITGLYPESIFCAIETSGDGRVNVQSRVQMFLFKARLAAQREYAEALEKVGATAEDVRAFLAAHPRFASGLHRSPHAAAGTAADRLAEIAPFMTGGKSKGKAAIVALQARTWAVGSLAAVRTAPARLKRLGRSWSEKSPRFFAQVREEWEDARPILTEQFRARAKAGMDGMRAAVTGRGIDKPVEARL
jgi:predicted nucleotide-binding protein (sugar kinase/HSP70/actin superfamily)